MFPHIEDHNFYIDHWSHTVLWNKVREFGALLSDHAFLADTEDVFGATTRSARRSGAADRHPSSPAQGAERPDGPLIVER